MGVTPPGRSNVALDQAGDFWPVCRARKGGGRRSLGLCEESSPEDGVGAFKVGMQAYELARGSRASRRGCLHERCKGSELCAVGSAPCSGVPGAARTRKGAGQSQFLACSQRREPFPALIYLRLGCMVMVIRGRAIGSRISPSCAPLLMYMLFLSRFVVFFLPLFPPRRLLFQCYGCLLRF